MDSFEWNKIAGAVLFALLVSFGLSIFSEILFEAERPETPGYVIAVPEGAPEGGAGEVAERQPIALLLASADPAAGEASAKKCASCHTFGEGEPAKTGPNLWNVVMRPVAGTDYQYSPDLAAYAQQAPVWDYEPLDAFLHDPKGLVPGTKMAFAGLKNDAERANVVAYLRSLSPQPAPLPPPPAAAPAEGTAPAAAGAPDAEATAPVAATPPEQGQPAPGQPATSEAPGAAAPVSGSAGAAAPAAGAPAPSQAAPAPGGQEGAAQTAAPAAPEAAGESGGGGQTTGQPAGSLGAVDSVPADQQGGVPQVPPIEQAEPEPDSGQSDEPGAVPPQGQPGAQPAPAPAGLPAAAPAGQPAPPAGQPAPAAGQPAPPPAGQPAPPAAEQPAPAGQPAPAAQPDQQGAAPVPAAEAQQLAAAPAPGAAPQAPAAAAAPVPPAPAPQANAQPPAQAAAPAAAASGFTALVAAADPAKGESFARRCAACHTFEKDGANRVGPRLWGVVNRPVASVPDYQYSEAMIGFSAGGQKLWTYDELSGYLADPQGHVPGTKMAFPGIKNEGDRANLIGYLRTLADSPAPL